MGFAWTAISIGDEITAAVIAEIYTNLNTLYSNLSLSIHSWTKIPTQNEIIPATQFTEFKDVTDNAEDQNYCRTHNATHDSSRNATHDTTLYSDHDVTLYSDHDTTVNSGHDSSIQSDNYIGYDGGVNTTAKYGHNNQVYDGWHPSHLSGHYLSADDYVNTTN